MSLQRSWPLFCLLLLLVVGYGPTVATGGLLATGDALGYYLPTRAIAAASVLNGEWPFWNPFNFAGIPLLAAFQGGVLYPANWTFLALPPQAAMNAAVLLGYFLAGLATYAYARALVLPRAAAFLAGACFMGGGYMVAHLEHLTMLHGAAMLPAMCWAIERHATDRRAAPALASFVALQLFAGYPQTVIVSLLLVGAYALWRHGHTPRRLLPLLAAVALGIGLGAIQWLPASALLAASQRGHMDYAELVATSLPPRQLASLLFPFLFGAEPSPLFPTPYWGAGTWQNELTGYMGLVPLMLAVAALGAWRTRPAVRFWTVSGGVTLLLAMGGATPVYRLWALVPVLKIVRVPGRHLLEVDFALAVLAACGLAFLLEAAPAARRRWAHAGAGLVGGAVLAGIVAVAVAGPMVASRLQPLMPAGIDLARALSPAQPAVWLPAVFAGFGALALLGLARRPGPTFTAIALALALADLGLFGQYQGWRQLCPHPAVAPPLPAPPGGTGRVLAIDATGYPFHDYARMRALGYPQLGALWGVATVNGYEPMLGERYGRLVGGLSLSGVLQDYSVLAPGHHALDLLACRELRASPVLLTDPAWRARLAPPRWQPGPVSRLVAVFTNPRALPPLWRATRAYALSSEGVDALVASGPANPTALATMVDGHAVRFDPATTALLDDGPAPATLAPGPARATATGFDHFAFETDGAGPGLVVWSEAYDAGWRAFAGAREFAVRRVDGLVMGVEVPAGHQVVRLAYAPRRWGAGVALSLASLVIGLVWGFAVRRPVEAA